MVHIHGLNGNSNRPQEEQNSDSHYRDVYRLMMHFQSLDQQKKCVERGRNYIAQGSD
jgi:hypothetical protein